ncbi:glycosyltransferase family 31 protein [Hypoxylon cercidicola]|nr:glycosyltransferase family 31 protein [Hypoxylon cercidicola]
MPPSKVSRVLVLTSVVLLFLVTYTTLYLYHSAPPSYRIADSQVAPIQDAAPIDDEPQEPQAAHVASVAETTQQPTSLVELDSSADAGDNLQEEQQLPLPGPKACGEDLEFLLRASIDLELTERVRYTRRYIQPHFSGTVDRDDVMNITEPLIQGDIEVDLYDCEEALIPPTDPIKLHVPHPHPAATFTHLVFGIATDFHRLNDSIRPFSHWISGTGAKLVAVVTDAKGKSPSEMGELQHNYNIAGINATLVVPINDSFTTSENHFSVLVNMLEYGNSDTEWYGLLDDDTFFPSLKPLSDSLATLDHSVDAYVGALSEDFAAVRTFGFMAFGGAGAFLSAPLAKKLGDQALQCIDGATSREGDIIIRDCVYTNSKAKLTILPGLYQQDMNNDVSGFFEAGLRPLNLHHWKSWYREPVEKMAKAATFCGDCFLQRWRFGTDTVFSNGFSIATYRDGVASVDLQSMEGTWEKTGRDFDFSIGPLRDRLPADKKKSYKLRDAEFADNGDLKQLYVRVGNSSAGELDQVIELIWQKH